MPTYTRNKKAYHDYFIEEEYEAGIKLYGSEVKAIREGKGNLLGSYIRIIKEEIWLVGFNLPAYSRASDVRQYDPMRPRKLLLSRKEINTLSGKAERLGYTLVPLKIYSKKSLLKIAVGLARGKRKQEKKEVQIRKQIDRDTERLVKESMK